MLLICISGAVILHFITRYLYLRAHRQLALEGLQQAAAGSTGPGNHSNQPPGNASQPGVEMHTVKPTVIVVQPDEEVSFRISAAAMPAQDRRFVHMLQVPLLFNIGRV